MKIRHLCLGNIKQLTVLNRLIQTTVVKEDALLHRQGMYWVDLETNKQYLPFSLFQLKSRSEQKIQNNLYVDDNTKPFPYQEQDISEEEALLHYRQLKKSFFSE